MITFIKTAIVTIVISFISGWLLDHYKSMAPKILCNVGDGVPIRVNNKKVYAYVLTVTNVSGKIIHELTINIQSLKSSLQIADAKITRGLKFHSSIKDNTADISIPFLSKKDKFSVVVYIENKNEPESRPVITIRSPEKFKEMRSTRQTGSLSSLHGNINNANSKKARKTRMTSFNKKTLVYSISIMIIIVVGILGKSYLKQLITSAKTTDKGTNYQQSTNSTERSSKTTKDNNTGTSKGVTTKNTDSKTSSDNTAKDTTSKTSDDTVNNTDSKTPSANTTNTTGNTDSKTSSDQTIKNTDSKTSSDGTAKNADSNTSSGGTTKNADSKTSSNESTGNTTD